MPVSPHPLAVRTCPPQILSVLFRESMLYILWLWKPCWGIAFIWCFSEMKPSPPTWLHFAGQSLTPASSFASQQVSSFVCRIDWNGRNRCSCFSRETATFPAWDHRPNSSKERKEEPSIYQFTVVLKQLQWEFVPYLHLIFGKSISFSVVETVSQAMTCPWPWWSS